jgi:hypothetical protein
MTHARISSLLILTAAIQSRRAADPSASGGMDALLLSAAGMLRVREIGAQGLMEPDSYGEWHWCHACNVWVPGDWGAHHTGGRHYESLRIITVRLASTCMPAIHIGMIIAHTCAEACCGPLVTCCTKWEEGTSCL